MAITIIIVITVSVYEEKNLLDILAMIWRATTEKMKPRAMTITTIGSTRNPEASSV